jgi:hypothetical protein
MNRVGMRKRRWLGSAFVAAAMLAGRALPTAAQTSPVSVWARSHNQSSVDVYLLCGDRDARWLGTLQPNESAALDFPAASKPCVQGLNFFLVDRDHNRGYWVAPMYLRSGWRVDLVIEKYAGLSSSHVTRER